MTIQTAIAGALGGMQHQQAPVLPVSVRDNAPGNMVHVGLGRDMTLTFRGSALVMVEVNGMQYAPINNDQHTEWFKSLIKGGMPPVKKDKADLDRIVIDYLFDAAIKTRMGE